MAGRMGGKNATVKNSMIVSIDTEAKLIVVKGGVPGHPESIVKIRLTSEKKAAPEIVKYVTETPQVETPLAETNPQPESVPPSEAPAETKEEPKA